jgi:hypothetical protein
MITSASTVTPGHATAMMPINKAKIPRMSMELESDVMTQRTFPSLKGPPLG